MSLNSASLRASLHAYLQVVSTRQDLSTSGVNHAGDLIRKIDAAIEQVQSKEFSITASTVLSDTGKGAALGQLAEASVSRFAFVSRVIESQEGDIAGMKTALFTVKAPVSLGTDPIVQYLAGKEMRDRLHGLTQQERDMAFVQAADVSDDPDEQANRDAIVWAVQATPGGARVTPDILRRVLAERAERANPQTVKRLHEVEALHETLSGLRDAVVDWLRSLGGDQKKIYDELAGPEPTLPPMEREQARRQVQSTA